MESFIDSTFTFVDQETDIELEISKLIAKQEIVNYVENYDEVDNEISKLIQTFREEEREQKESGKPSISSCASILMSFLNKLSDKELLSSAGRSLRLGCLHIGKCIEPSADSNNEVLNGEDLEVNIPQSAELESELELETAPSSQCFGQVGMLDLSSISKFAQLQGPSRNVMPAKMEGAPLPLSNLHVSPTSKIVNRFSQLKQTNHRGPNKKPRRPNC